MSANELPPYLHNTEPMELDDLPLQLALLTMEAAWARQQISRLMTHLGQQSDPAPTPPTIASSSAPTEEKENPSAP